MASMPRSLALRTAAASSRLPACAGTEPRRGSSVACEPECLADGLETLRRADIGKPVPAKRREDPLCVFVHRFETARHAEGGWAEGLRPGEELLVRDGGALDPVFVCDHHDDTRAAQARLHEHFRTMLRHRSPEL